MSHIHLCLAPPSGQQRQFGPHNWLRKRLTAFPKRLAMRWFHCAMHANRCGSHRGKSLSSISCSSSLGCHLSRSIPCVNPSTRSPVLSQQRSAFLLQTLRSQKRRLPSKGRKMKAREIARLQANDSQECRNCHQVDRMLLAAQTAKAQEYHQAMLTNGKTCIDCHSGIAHPENAGTASLHY